MCSVFLLLILVYKKLPIWNNFFFDTISDTFPKVFKSIEIDLI